MEGLSQENPSSLIFQITGSVQLVNMLWTNFNSIEIAPALKSPIKKCFASYGAVGI